MDTQYRRRIRLSILATLIIALAGCSKAGAEVSPKSGVFLSYEKMTAEYREAAALIDLPPGEVWPESPPGERDAQYEEGFGSTQAEILWFCAWQREWLARLETDPLRAEYALETMEAVTDTGMYRIAYDDVSRSVVDERLDTARNGDTRAVKRDVLLNCT